MISPLAGLACKAFLERQPPQRQKRLASFLPKVEQVQMEAIQFAHSDWIDFSFRLDEALDTVHPSWIIPQLQACTSLELGCFLASLHSNQAKSIKSFLHYLRPLPMLTSLGKTYLRTDLLTKISGIENIIPLRALPASRFNPLASFAFRDLVRLGFLLGLKDLGHYLRQVIDKAKIKSIEQALSAEEWQTVQQLSLKKDPLVAGRQGFSTWDGRPEKLRMLVEQRGINRLAKALFGEHPSLLWYVTHIFDVPRASFFETVCTENPSEATRDLVQEQVLEAVTSFLGRG